MPAHTAVVIEPEAGTMLETLAMRLYPERRAGKARALVLEMYRQVMGDAASDKG